MKAIACVIAICCLSLAPRFANADDPCEYEGGKGGVDYEIAQCSKVMKQGNQSNERMKYLYATRAEAWIKKGEYKKALADCNNALRLDPDYSKAQFNRATSLVWLGKYDEAISDYNAVIDYGGSDGELKAYVGRSSAYGLKGMLDKSIADSTKAIEQASTGFSPRIPSVKLTDPDFNPNRARALYNRGLAWKLKGDYQKAIQDYYKAIRSNPGDPHSWTSLPDKLNNLSTKEQASLLYKDIKFSPDINTSDPRIYGQVWDVIKTRYGDAILVQTDILPAGTVMFNGKIVFDGKGMYVSLDDHFQRTNSDVILIGSNPGGSATPASGQSFLIINSDGTTQVLSDPDFVSSYDGSMQATMDKDQRIYVKLGFPIEVGPNRSKTEPVAMLDSGKLTMIHLSRVHSDYRVGSARSLDEYFTGDKWLAVRETYKDSTNSQRIEYFCDDKEIMKRYSEDDDSAGYSHVLCAVALFAKQSGQWIFQEQYEMPYGGSVQEFTNHRVILDSTEYTDDDGFANPTGDVTKVFNTQSGKLIEDIEAEKKLASKAK